MDDIVTRLREEPCGETWCDQCRIYSEAADEIQRLQAERDRLRRLVAELLPFMVEDVRQGVSLGELPFDSNHCGSEDSSCPDCEWYKDSVVWLERINAGEFSEYGQTKHAE